MSPRSVPILVTVAAVLCLGIIVIGVRFLLVPESSAAGYGVPASADGDAAAYLAIKGLRDLASGVIGLVLLSTRQLRASGLFMLTASIIPFGDTAIVLAHGGSTLLAFAVHAGTGAVMVLAGTLLIRATPRLPG
jgi:uncharacterized membrane protein